MTTATPMRDAGVSRRTPWGMALTLSVLLMGMTFLSEPLLAQAELTTAHEYTYGQSARFTATLLSDESYTDLRLFLRIPRPTVSDTELLSPLLSEGVAVYERDLRLNPFPPYASLTYWWTFTDGDGISRQTNPVTFLYEDNRFVWQELQEGEFIVRWVAGTPERMVAALDIAREATAKITAQLHTADPGVVLFYIYPSAADLQAALRLTGQEWLGGMSLPEVGVVLLAVPSTDAAYTQMRADIPHELTHQILYRHLGDAGYAALPTWLVEGLAALFEQRVDAQRAALLDQAQKDGRLLSLADLCAPFYSLDTERLRLGYAESFSAVSYLQSTYGWSGVRGLLQSYADGRECSVGIKHALGTDLSTFERGWRTWLAQGGKVVDGNRQWLAAASLVLRDLAPWLVLAGFLILPAIFSLFQRRASRTVVQG